jgi:mannose-6-phosphate isomerase-like protein (cupin superfamily)
MLATEVARLSNEFSSIHELGDTYGFRKVREALGVSAFGVNVLVFPPGAEGTHHYHDEQDELYFVHTGSARFDVDGEVRELGPGGLCHVDAKTPRRVKNVGPDDLVLLVVGGKGGYVGRDGRLVDPADLPKRQAISRGEFDV